MRILLHGMTLHAGDRSTKMLRASVTAKPNPINISAPQINELNTLGNVISENILALISPGSNCSPRHRSN